MDDFFRASLRASERSGRLGVELRTYFLPVEMTVTAPSAVRAALLSLTLAALAACGDRKPANSDSTLSRDLSLANAPAVQPPVFQDTAMNPAPAAAKAQPREQPAPARTRARP